MCDNYRKTRKRKVVGYKLVAVKEGTKQYYSAAMGFKYLKNGKIPICKKQKRIRDGFSDVILQYHFSKEMVGRTAVFLNHNDVYGAFNMSLPTIPGYFLKIVKVELSKNLLLADYCGYTVYVGRHLKFLE